MPARPLLPATAEQDKRRDQDPWDDILAEAKGIVLDDEERISTADLMTIHLKLPPERQTDAAAKRLSFWMARLGWTKAPNQIRIAGKLVR